MLGFLLKDAYVKTCRLGQVTLSLAPPAYVLPLNFHFPSVLRLGLRYIRGFSPDKFCQFNQRTEGVVENNEVEVVR